jgi:endonuclease/exonuclease/phosphatase (EEP) superfamily protein YafD
VSTSRQPFQVRVAAGVLAWLALAAVAAAVVTRAGGWEVGGAEGAAVLALLPLALPVTVVAGAVALAARVLPAVVAAVLLVAVQLTWLVPRAVAGQPPGDGTRLIVMAANLQHGLADPAAVVRAVAVERPDVLALSELTPGAVAALDRAGLAALLPHRVLRAERGAGGTGLYATSPLTGEPGPAPTTFNNPRATVRLAGRAVTLQAVHASPPFRPGAWRRDLALLREATAEAAAAGPAVVLGDFNATADHAGFRAILAAGVRDAHDAAGRGLVGTWPADRRFPPLVAIDHVLVSEHFAVAGVGELALPGSDHLAVVADLVLRLPHDR